MPRSGFLMLVSALLAAAPGFAQGPVVPSTLVVPLGTVVTVQIQDRISSDQNFPGDEFRATLQQPLVVDGWVISRPGQTVVGRVDSARRAGRTQGSSELRLELSEIVLVDGQQLPLRTQLLQSNGPSAQGENVGAIAAGTGLGAVIGAAAGGGQGAAIGAAAGAIVSVAGVLSTRGRATEIYPETSLTFRLDTPLAVSTLRGQQAFLPVTAADYACSNPPELRRAPARIVAPPPYYYPQQVYVSSPSIAYVPRVPVRERVVVLGPRVVVEPRIIIGGRNNSRGNNDHRNNGRRH